MLIIQVRNINQVIGGYAHTKRVLELSRLGSFFPERHHFLPLGVELAHPVVAAVGNEIISLAVFSNGSGEFK